MSSSFDDKLARFCILTRAEMEGIDTCLVYVDAFLTIDGLTCNATTSCVPKGEDGCAFCLYVDFVAVNSERGCIAFCGMGFDS